MQHNRSVSFAYIPPSTTFSTSVDEAHHWSNSETTVAIALACFYDLMMKFGIFLPTGLIAFASGCPAAFVSGTERDLESIVWTGSFGEGTGLSPSFMFYSYNTA